jgi:hypothetical protein
VNSNELNKGDREIRDFLGEIIWCYDNDRSRS